MTHPTRKRKNRSYTAKKNASTYNASQTATKIPAKKGVSGKRTGNLFKGAIGTNAMTAVTNWATMLKPFEMAYPTNMQTFHEMYTSDDAIGAVLNSNYALVENAFSNWSIRSNPTSEDSQLWGDLIKHIFNNMNDSTIRTVARNAATFNQFGFSILEKDYRKLSDNEYTKPLPEGISYEDVWAIDKLRMIPQRSLDPTEPFVITDLGRTIKGCLQSPQWFTDSSTLYGHAFDVIPESIFIPRNKFLLFGMNITDSSPMGTSPLEHVWTAWKEKLFFEKYFSVAVSKDMSGMPLVEIPQDILNKANTDPSSPSGKLVEQIANDVSALHAGEANMMMLPSDPFSQTNSSKAYSLKFLGIEGTGKQFDLQEAIDKRREAIYQAFGALNLISNANGGGSYNLLEGQTNIHMYFVQRVINIITEGINNDLIPQIISLCGGSLSAEDVPRFEAGNISEVGIEEFSKGVMRLRSVNSISMTKDSIIEIQRKMGFRTEALEQMTEEEVIDTLLAVDAGDTKVGQSMGTSGTGNSQVADAGSDVNSENAG